MLSVATIARTRQLPIVVAVSVAVAEVVSERAHPKAVSLLTEYVTAPVPALTVVEMFKAWL